MKMMKRRIQVTFSLLLFSALLWSCEDGTESPTPDNNDLEVRSSFVSNSNAALNQLRNLGFSGPIGALYGHSGGTNGRIASSPIAMMRQSTHQNNDDPNYCYTETWQDDGKGNFRYVIDFGDGCDFYGSYMYGKMEEVGSYTDSTYSSSVTYDHFGGSEYAGSADWWIDGNYTYKGTWLETYGEIAGDTTELDSSDYWDDYYFFESEYEYTADITQTYIEFIGAPEDSVTTGEEIYIIDYVASGHEKMDETGYTVLSMTSDVSSNTGEEYTSKVESPLFMDYTCYEEDVWTYVSGIESGTYSYDGSTSTYSIDYGDGTCDNIILLTENGVTEEIDLGEEWDNWEEECEGEGHNG